MCLQEVTSEFNSWYLCAPPPPGGAATGCIEETMAYELQRKQNKSIMCRIVFAPLYFKW